MFFFFFGTLLVVSSKSLETLKLKSNALFVILFCKLNSNNNDKVASSFFRSNQA